MIANLLMVGAGGAAGSILRYLLQTYFNTDRFSYGTLLVNIGGCFVAGLLAAFLLKNARQDELSLLLLTGFCGGFTTFSAFSLESVQLFETGNWLLLSLYLSISVTGGFLAALVAYKFILR